MSARAMFKTTLAKGLLWQIVGLMVGGFIVAGIRAAMGLQSAAEQLAAVGRFFDELDGGWALSSLRA